MKHLSFFLIIALVAPSVGAEEINRDHFSPEYLSQIETERIQENEISESRRQKQDEHKKYLRELARAERMGPRD